jgi:hypothetical protein
LILEQPVVAFLVFETSDDDGDTWVEWTGALNTVESNRGGKRSGASSTVEVGTLTATLINAGDPLDSEDLKPNVKVRLRHRVTDDTVYTGRIVDLSTAYQLDKQTGETTTLVTLVTADAVRSHSAVTRYGAVTDGGAGFETWALRMNRLAASAMTDVNPPADDSPIVRYAI